MIRLILFFLFVLSYGCSFNTSSEFWNQKKQNKIVSKKKEIKLLTKDKSFEKYKKEFIEYGKNNEFPNINN